VDAADVTISAHISTGGQSNTYGGRTAQINSEITAPASVSFDHPYCSKHRKRIWSSDTCDECEKEEIDCSRILHGADCACHMGHDSHPFRNDVANPNVHPLEALAEVPVEPHPTNVHERLQKLEIENETLRSRLEAMGKILQDKFGEVVF